tara:strand:- start:65 stop:313 length:249 start_codon:yes stop_codon:yes gene_type:complete
MWFSLLEHDVRRIAYAADAQKRSGFLERIFLIFMSCAGSLPEISARCDQNGLLWINTTATPDPHCLRRGQIDRRAAWLPRSR